MADENTPVTGENIPGEEKSPMFMRMAAALKENMEGVIPSAPPPGTPQTTEQKAADPPGEQPKTEAQPAPAKPESTPQPEPEKKPEAAKPADELPEAIKKASPKASQEFKNLRQTLTAEVEAKAKALAATQEELNKAKAALEAANKQPQLDPDALAKLKEERDNYATLLEKVALEQSPTFKQRYEPRQEAVMAQAATAAGDKKEVVLSLLELPPSDSRRKQLATVVKDMEMSDAMSLSIAFNEMDKIRSEKSSELANHRAVLQRDRDQEALLTTQQQAAEAARKDHILKEVLRVAANEFDAFKRTGKAEDDAQVADYEKDVEKFVKGNMTPVESAFIPLMAVEGMHLKSKIVPALKAEVDALKAQIAQMTKTVPSPEPTGEAETDAAATTGTKSRFIEAFKRAQAE